MTGTRTHEELLDRVRKLCEDLEPHLDDGAARVRRTRSSLDQPLRLAVVGRVSTGKSTLVNALIGRRIAPTSAGECTRVVTWYGFGAPDQAHLHLRDGSTRPLRLQEGGLPDALGVAPTEVDRLEVRLTSGPLRSMTLIDTPGLDTLTEANDEATKRAILGSRDTSQRAAGEADALLYLIGEAARSSDIEFLADFRAASGRAGATSVNTIGILGHADLFGAGPFDPEDPFDIARLVSARLAGDHPSDLSAVVAVSGLLAETARTGRVSEALARRLADLAAEDSMALSLRRQDRALADLFRLLGPYGMENGRAPAVGGAADLKDWCERTSGAGELEAILRTRLIARSGPIKATRAMATLGALARSAPSAGRGHALDLVESALLDPALHPLDELRAFNLASAAAPTSPLAAQLALFLDDRDPAAILGVAGGASDGVLIDTAQRRSAEATRAASLGIVPAEIDAGRVLARSYQLLARRLRRADVISKYQ